MNSYLSSIKLNLSKGAYIDAGIAFPFFYKDNPAINVQRWVGDVHEWVTHNNIYVTLLVQREINRAYNRVPIAKAERRGAKKLYKLILQKLIVVNVPISEHDTVLSREDLSLLNRPDQDKMLITADQYLFNRDKNAILIGWDNVKNELTVHTK